MYVDVAIFYMYFDYASVVHMVVGLKYTLTFSAYHY